MGPLPVAFGIALAYIL